jgi:hypothetical protein
MHASRHPVWEASAVHRMQARSYMVEAMTRGAGAVSFVSIAGGLLQEQTGLNGQNLFTGAGYGRALFR